MFKFLKSLPHVDEETYLRSLKRQIECVKELAKELKYDSADYQTLLSLHEEVQFEETIKRDNLTQYEEVSVLIFQVHFFTKGFQELLGHDDEEQTDDELDQSYSEESQNSEFKVPDSPSTQTPMIRNKRSLNNSMEG